MRKHILPVVLALAAQIAWAAGQDGKPPTSVEIVAKRDAEWASYRHAYKAANMFEKHTRTRPLIQAHMQIVPRREGFSVAGMRIQLAGETVTQDIAVDAIGRSTLPMLKAAYDEDAVLRLNRQKGNFRFTGRYSIRENDSGIYGAAQLRAACEELIGAQRDSGSRIRLLGKKCAGVRFIFAPASAPGVTFRDDKGKASAIAALDATPFDNTPMGMFKVVTYRFDAWPAQGEVVTAQRPLFIGTHYE